jgi:hypothetical protein
MLRLGESYSRLHCEKATIYKRSSTYLDSLRRSLLVLI